MADCSYARCVQERRFIRRELSKWTKSMVFIVGLERVAEELMGRRKWKLYQDVLTHSNLNLDTTNLIEKNTSTVVNNNNGHPQEDAENLMQAEKLRLSTENHITRDDESVTATTTNIKREDLIDLKKSDAKDIDELNNCSETKENVKDFNDINKEEKEGETEVEDNKIFIKKDQGDRVVAKEDEDQKEIVIKQEIIETNSLCDEHSHREQPIDWKPQDKCYFCVDGKLLTVNDVGELVAEVGPAQTEAELTTNTTIPLHLSESESCESSSEQEVPTRPPPPPNASSSAAANHLPLINSQASVASLLRGVAPPDMTSLESMAAHFAAMQQFQNLPQFAQFYPNFFYPQFQQQMSPAMPPTSSAQENAPINSPAPTQHKPTTSAPEQPLDLSAKSSTPGGSNAFKAKPRISAVGGRRSYTEEELQNALQDILSGKLGTRRAAVLYGIPRSTLRNKVYKLSMEQKREEELAAAMPPAFLTPQIVDDDGGDSGAEDHDKDTLLSSNQVYVNAMKNFIKMYDPASSSTSSSTATSNHENAKMHEMHSNKLGTSASTPTPPPASQLASHQLAQQQQAQQQQNMWQNLLMGGGPAGLAALPALLGQQQQQQQQQQQHQQQLHSSSSSKSKHHQQQQQQQQVQQPPQLDETMLPELIRKFLIQQQELINEQFKNSSEHLNNGQQQHMSPDPRVSLMHNLMQQQQQLMQSKLRKSGTPESTMTVATPSSSSTTTIDLNDGADNAAVILKIPSLKAVGGGQGGPSASTAAATINSLNNSALALGLGVASASPLLKNGLDNLSSASPPRLQRPLLSDSPQSVHHHMSTPSSVTSPVSSLMRQRSESQSPPLSLASSKDMLTMNEVIAKSISRNFQHPDGKLKHSQLLDQMEQYKRPSISVIKNIGGTDISRFGSNPNIALNHHHSLMQHGHRDRHRDSDRDSLSNTGTGGKGTRPKRGKYRNYDRDSLVEAVKAVQRGEMSVHRAGSYYGVPHSTLEYKVKERHLMRPRKREPKPQLDTAVSPSSANISAATQKAQDVIGSGTLRALEKNKASGMPQMNKQQQQALKTPPPASFSANSPNGMKMFDPAMAAYTSQLFWQHHPNYAALPMEFGRQAGVGGVTTAEQFFASQMMQKFQEESLSRNLNSSSASSSTKSMTNSNGGGGGVNSISTTAAAASKSTRDLAESLYDTANTNGSFFEGIIRHSLDKKPNDVLGVHGGALFEQLIKNSNSINRSNSLDENSFGLNHHNNNSINKNNNSSSKRSASPLNFTQQNIKRERRTSSSSASSSSGESCGAGGVSDRHRRSLDEDGDEGHPNDLSNNSSSKLYDNFGLNNASMENLFKLRELQQLKAAAESGATGGSEGAIPTVTNTTQGAPTKSSSSSASSTSSSASNTPPSTAAALRSVSPSVAAAAALAQLPPSSRDELNNGTSAHHANEREDDDDDDSS